MSSSFVGLDIAYRALQAQQQAIDVTNHNIANANTSGYSRQIVQMAATAPYTVPSLCRSNSAGQMGTGVEVTDVLRARYSFVDYQIRNESQTQGSWEKMRDALRQVEVVLNEPSDSGLNSLLSKFWQTWHDLANNPQDAGTRTTLVEQADSLAVAFNRAYSQLTSIQQDMDGQIVSGVDRINDLEQRIASLNAQISQVELLGQHANDLRDQRDLVLDELSRLVRITYSEDRQGQISVFLGGRALVSGTEVENLSITKNADGFADVIWKSDGSIASITDGELFGLQQSRDVELPGFINDLQTLAGQLIDSVNALHRTGYGLDGSTNLDFFGGSGANDMSVNPDVKLHPEKVAAAGSSGSPGDNSIAIAIAELERAQLLSGGTVDFSGFLTSVISRLGADAQRADMMVSNQQVLVDHLTRQKESFSGVSLDEETTHLVAYQRAYEAAARVVSVVDEMLDKLINSTGLIGR